VSNPEELRERILQSTYDCIARWGSKRTSIEDAAREAGVSRATIYRYFPGGREELLNAVVSWEYGRFFERLYEQVSTATTLEEVLERGLPFAHRAIEHHEVLQMVLRTEPELLEPTFSAVTSTTNELVAAFLTPYLEHHELAEGVVVAEAADYLARMVLSYMSSPGRWDLDDAEQVATLVRAELLGGIVPR